MKYPDGRDVLTGDSLVFDSGRTPGEIVAVVADDLSEYRVTEPGVMVKAAGMGLVFIPVSLFAEQQLALQARGKATIRWDGA